MARTFALGFLLFVALASPSSAQDEGGVGPSEDLSEVLNLWFSKHFFRKKIILFKVFFWLYTREFGDDNPQEIPKEYDTLEGTGYTE